MDSHTLYEKVAAEFLRRYFIPLDEVADRLKINEWIVAGENPTEICDTLELKYDLVRYEI